MHGCINRSKRTLSSSHAAPQALLLFKLPNVVGIKLLLTVLQLRQQQQLQERWKMAALKGRYSERLMLCLIYFDLRLTFSAEYLTTCHEENLIATLRTPFHRVYMQCKSSGTSIPG